MTGDAEPECPPENSPAPSGGGSPQSGLFIIDTSVAIKWYLPEVHQTAAQRFLDPTYDRHAPEFLHAELGSVLLKKVRRNELTAEEAQRYLGLLDAVPLMTHDSLPLRLAAFAIALQVGSSFYDGLFLAMALQLGGRLVTADDKLYKKIQGGPLGAWILWVADPL